MRIAGRQLPVCCRKPISVCKVITDHHGEPGNIITTACDYSHYPQAHWCYMTGLSFQTDVPQGHLSCHVQLLPSLLLHNYCSGQGRSKVRPAAWVGAKWAAKGCIVAYLYQICLVILWAF